MKIKKPKEYWLNPHPDCRGWSSRKPDQDLLDMNPYCPPIRTVEKQAYDKVIKALKYYAETDHYINPDINGDQLAKDTLKELGEYNENID